MPGGTIKALAYVLDDLRTDVLPSEWAVMVALCDWVDDEYKCFPKIANVAKRARVSRATAKRALLNLTEMGELTCTKRYRPNGSQTSNEYQFTLASATAPPGQIDPPPQVTQVSHPPGHPGEPPKKNPPTEPPIKNNPLPVSDETDDSGKPNRPKYSEAFLAFWADYGKIGSKSLANKAWKKKLTADQRRLAHQCISLYKSSLPDWRSPVDGVRYLTGEEWENFVEEDGTLSDMSSGISLQGSGTVKSVEPKCETCRGASMVERESDGLVIKCPECNPDPLDALTPEDVSAPSLPPRADLD